MKLIDADKLRKDILQKMPELSAVLILIDDQPAAITSVWEVYHYEDGAFMYYYEDGAFIGLGTCEQIHVTDEWHATKEAAEAAKERLEKTGGHCFYYVAERKVTG